MYPRKNLKMAAGLYNLIILHFTDIIQTNSTTNVWCDDERQEFSLMPQIIKFILTINFKYFWSLTFGFI